MQINKYMPHFHFQPINSENWNCCVTLYMQDQSNKTTNKCLLNNKWMNETLIFQYYRNENSGEFFFFSFMIGIQQECV